MSLVDSLNILILQILSALATGGAVVCGNALMIYGFHLGVLGAALATLAGRVFAAVWILLQQQKQTNPYRMAGI